MSNTTGEQVAAVDFAAMDSETAKLYRLDGRPPFRLAYPVALQHLLAMFTSNLAPILIISSVAQATTSQVIIMIQAAMFAAGAATLLNCYPVRIGKVQIGAGLPIVMGTSMTFVPPATAVALIAVEMGHPNPIGVVLGGLIVASVSEVVLGALYKYLRPFFPPHVLGAMLLSLGISLLTVGTNNFGGGSPAANPYFGSAQNMMLAGFVFLLYMFLQRFGKGIFKLASVLFALIAGYVAAILIGIVDFYPVTQAAIFELPRPLALGPVFYPWAITMFLAVYVVSGLATIGYTHTITTQSMNRPSTNRETSGAIYADAVSSAFAGLFNSLPNTEFGQNASLVANTKIISKWVVALCAFTLIAASVFPPIGAVFATVPPPVLGGAILAVFAFIMTNAIAMIAKTGFSQRKLTSLCIMFAVGLGFAPPGNAALIQSFPAPMHFIFSDRVLLMSVVAVVVNIFFMEREDFEKIKNLLKNPDTDYVDE
ncbi:MAG: purine/pyrimidine permease [Defluviitaleaceae bacterium]|nr:purine/pyrimidine permease [Defluviitaleaceae bacterium]